MEARTVFCDNKRNTGCRVRFPTALLPLILGQGVTAKDACRFHRKIEPVFPYGIVMIHYVGYNHHYTLRIFWFKTNKMTFLRRSHTTNLVGNTTNNTRRFNLSLTESNWIPTVTVDSGSRVAVSAVGSGFIYNGSAFEAVTPAGTDPVTEVTQDPVVYGGTPALGRSPFNSEHTESFYGIRRVTWGSLAGIWIPEGDPAPGYSQVKAISLGTETTIKTTAPSGGGRYTLYICLNWLGNYYADNQGSFSVFITPDTIFEATNPVVLSWRTKVFDAGGDISDEIAIAVDALANTMVASGIDIKMSYLNLLCGESLTATFPLYSPSNLHTPSASFGSLDYTAYNVATGLQGNGTGYLDTGLDIMTLATQDISFGCWINQLTTGVAVPVPLGSSYTATAVNRCYILVDETGTGWQAGLGGCIASPSSSYIGLIMLTYDGVTFPRVYQNGVNGGLSAPGNADTWQDNGTFRVLAGAGFTCNNRLTNAFIGKALTAGNATNFYNALLTFYTAIGRSLS